MQAKRAISGNRNMYISREHDRVLLVGQGRSDSPRSTRRTYFALMQRELSLTIK